MNIAAQRIRETDDKGQLVAAGFRWPQVRPKELARLKFWYWCSAHLAVWSLLAGVLFSVIPGAGGVGGPLLIVGMLSAFNAVRIRATPDERFVDQRAVVFRTDGRVMSTPEGKTDLSETMLHWENIAPGLKEPLELGNIQSISVKEGPRMPFTTIFNFRPRFTLTNTAVMVNLHDGRSVPIYGHLASKDEASVVAANLNQALDEVLRSLPRSARRR